MIDLHCTHPQYYKKHNLLFVLLKADFRRSNNVLEYHGTHDPCLRISLSRQLIVRLFQRLSQYVQVFLLHYDRAEKGEK